MHKVLIAADGSDHAARAAEFVVELAKVARLETVLVNVQPQPDFRSLALNREAILRAEREDATAAMAPAKQRLEAAQLPVTVRIEHGEPAQTIVRVAEETGCDHIVMGTRGLGSLAGLMLGSVATKVLHLAHVPVTLVK